MNREALIEEAFKAHEGAPSWQTDEVGRDAAIRWHMRGFNDALAMFEQAHTPTDDEREALATLLDELHDPCVTEGGCDFQGWTQAWSPPGRATVPAEPTEAVDRILAALRSPVQGEPTGAEVKAAWEAYITAQESDPYDREGRMRAALRAAAAVREGESRG